ncbi:hypothetical protein [Caldalkalibacillus mannanilyticus]|uniref:hypothetical protein n=1 Tax=Caldalkalibacillus mannanilyticus TaxID=1418 RepID=UPI00046AE9B4|nr:hypothetical protein [Caldalkalibacillus mannanilyticus]
MLKLKNVQVRIVDQEKKIDPLLVLSEAECAVFFHQKKILEEEYGVEFTVEEWNFAIEVLLEEAFNGAK